MCPQQYPSSSLSVVAGSMALSSRLSMPLLTCSASGRLVRILFGCSSSKLVLSSDYPQYMLIMRALQLEFIYNAIQLLFTWTSLANFYLAFFFVCAFACHRAQIFTSYVAGFLSDCYSSVGCLQLLELWRRKIRIRGLPESLHRSHLHYHRLFSRKSTPGQCLIITP